MPAEQGYTRQVGPAPAQRAVLTNADTFGAGVGQALEGAGMDLHRDQIRARQIEREATRDREWSDAAAKIAKHETDIAVATAEARANAGPGAAGHVAIVHEVASKGWDEILEGVTEKSVRARIEQRRVQVVEGTLAQEQIFEIGKRAEKTANDADQQADLRANLTRNGNAAAYVDQSKAWDEYVAGLSGVPADAKDNLRRVGHQKITVAAIQARMDEDPKMALALIKSGVFADILAPEQLEQLAGGAQVEIRRADAAAERAADAEKAAYRERVATYSEAHQQGIDIGDVSADIAYADKIGDTSTALKLRGMAADSQFAKVYSGATPLQRSRRQAELAGKPKPSVDEQRELKWLQDHAGALDAQFDKDPVGYAAEHAAKGAKPPALEFGNGDSWGARIRWASAASDTYGRETPILAAAEVSALRDLKEGAGGEAQVLRELDNIPDAIARKRVARQIDPNDVTFQSMALLQPQVRQRTRQGAEALKANPALIKPDKDHPDVADRMATMDNQLRQALRAFDPQDVEAVLTIGKQYLAGTLSANGLSINADDGRLYRTALRIAMGGENRNGVEYGGIARWGEGRFAVPESVPTNGIGPMIGAAIRRQASNPPVNPDKSALDLKRALPVYIGGGRYRFFVRGAPVKARDGSIYEIKIGAR